MLMEKPRQKGYLQAKICAECWLEFLAKNVMQKYCSPCRKVVDKKIVKKRLLARKKNINANK